MRVLVYSNDHVGSSMAGPGIRSYHFARELSRWFDVTLLTPRAPDVEIPDVEIAVAEGIGPDDLGRRMATFDAVVTQFLSIPTMNRLRTSRTRVVYDLYIPFVERMGFLDSDLAEHPDDDRSEHLFAAYSRLTQRYALATGSAFVCASERQRDLWLGMLANVGRIDSDTFRSDPSLRGLIDVAPFGLSADPPRAERRLLKGVYPGIRAQDRVLLWAGGVWNWLDPLTPIRAVARIAKRRDDVKLLFLGLARPVPAGQTAMAARAIELARGLGVLDRNVFFNLGWVAYDDRQSYLLEADAGVSAHFDSLETRFAFRTRLLDHFWAGLPTITTEGDVLADLVSAQGLGRVVGYGDVDAWERAIEAIVDAGRPAEAAFDAVRARFAWPAVVDPIATLLRRPAARGVRAPALRVEELVLRSRISLALGGPREVVRRQARKVGPRSFRHA